MLRMVTGARLCALLACASLLCFAAARADAAIVGDGGCKANVLPGNDDGSTGLVSLPFSVQYFGGTRTALYVNNNGNVTFDGPMSTYTPFPLDTTNRPIIAPLFGDVDTRPSASDKTTWGTTTFGGRTAFCVNWADVGQGGVGYYSNHTDKLNSFQLLIVDRSDTGTGNVDLVFNYDKIQWETGDASSGSGGFGGAVARAGYSSGDPSRSFEIPGSGISGAFLDNGPRALASHSANSTVPGRYVFSVRGGFVNPGRPSGLETDGHAAVVIISGLHSGSDRTQLVRPYQALTNSQIETQIDGGMQPIYRALKAYGLPVSVMPTENSSTPGTADDGVERVSSRDAPATSAWRLYRHLQWLRDHDSITKVAFVGHSMGGLFSRVAMANMPPGMRAVGLVTLATPHTGSHAAELCRAVNGGHDDAACAFLRSDSALRSYNQTYNNTRQTPIKPIGGTDWLTSTGFSWRWLPPGWELDTTLHGDGVVQIGSACADALHHDPFVANIGPCSVYHHMAHTTVLAAGRDQGSITANDDVLAETARVVQSRLNIGVDAPRWLAAGGSGGGSGGWLAASRRTASSARQQRAPRAAGEDATVSLKQLSPTGPVAEGDVVVTASIPANTTADLELEHDGDAVSATLRDDGVSPDTSAGDGVGAARVTLSPGQWLGDLSAGDATTGVFVDVAEDAVTASGPASLTTVDDDADSRVDAVQLTLPLTSTRDDDLTFTAKVTDEDGQEMPSIVATEFVSSGAQSIVLRQEADDLAGVHGEVRVHGVEVRDGSGTLVGRLDVTTSLPLRTSDLDLDGVAVTPADATPQTNDEAVQVLVGAIGDADAIEVSHDEGDRWEPVAGLVDQDGVLRGTASIPGLDEGPHRILARSLKNGSATGDVAQTVVLIDRTPPPAPTVDAGTSDWSENAQREITRHVEGESPAAFVTSVDGGADEQSAGSADVRTFGDGTHALSVRAVDAAGNVGPAGTATVRVDRTAPTIAVSFPADGQHVAQGDARAPAVSCDDGDGSGVASCSAPGRLDTATPGDHALVVTARDALGHESQLVRRYVVDAAPAQNGAGGITAKPVVKKPRPKLVLAKRLRRSALVRGISVKVRHLAPRSRVVLRVSLGRGKATTIRAGVSSTGVASLRIKLKPRAVRRATAMSLRLIATDATRHKVTLRAKTRLR